MLRKGTHAFILAKTGIQGHLRSMFRASNVTLDSMRLATKKKN